VSKSQQDKLRERMNKRQSAHDILLNVGNPTETFEEEVNSVRVTKTSDETIGNKQVIETSEEDVNSKHQHDMYTSDVNKSASDLFRERKKEKLRMEDTHKRETFLVERELMKRVDKLAKSKGRGFKTLFINLAIAEQLNKEEGN